MSSTRCCFACVAAIALACTTAASAQPLASSLDELKRLAPANSRVTVTDTKGQQFHGTIVNSSETVLSLQIARTIRRFQAADVESVRVRRKDSLVNGAVIGAAVGGGLTSLMFLDNECHDDPVCYQAVAVYGGLGAVAGLGIDALIHRNVVVYTAGTPSAPPRVTMTPIVGRGRKGVQLTLALRTSHRTSATDKTALTPNLR